MILRRHKDIRNKNTKELIQTPVEEKPIKEDKEVKSKRKKSEK